MIRCLYVQYCDIQKCQKSQLLPVEEYESRIHVRSKNCHDMNFGEFLHACRLSAGKDANTNVISLKYTKQK